MGTTTMAKEAGQTKKAREVLENVTVRFAGDSGDGVQITGGQFTSTAAEFGNDISTLPDFPAEIRAPAGTLPGVSGFQIQFASNEIHTPGDRPDVLVIFNPAALQVHCEDLPDNGILIIDTNQFDKAHLKKAGYTSNPLEDGSLSKYRLFAENITEKTVKALDGVDATAREKARCKNFYGLGMAYWLFNRPMDNTIKYLNTKYAKKPQVVTSTVTALKAGYAYCEMTDVFQAVAYEVPAAPKDKGVYRNISGNQALAMGLVAASEKSGRQLFYGAYPITPASDVLHELAKHKNFGVITFQAEDEIAAMAAVVGASFGGCLSVTGTSGPGSALKSEGLGLAVITELPLVLLNIQRGGPSTGLPTKTEQPDLLHALFSRHGECPLVVIASSTPGDCFETAFEACRIALKYMMPVYVLSDGYLANGAEPWKIPEVSEIPEIPVSLRTNPEGFNLYERDPETFAREWALPGTPGLEHRLGGLEKNQVSGNVSYDPQNHERMIQVRAEKVRRVLADVPDLEVDGPDDADVLVIGWGSTLGAIRASVQIAREKGLKVARAHFRFLNPMPANTGEVLARFDKILCPEINMGQLTMLLRAEFLKDIIGLNRVQGQPFKTHEIIDGIEALIEGRPVRVPSMHAED